MAWKPFITNLLGLDGTPEVGGLLQSYARGTTTPRPLYSDAGTTPLENPVEADSLGQITAYFNDILQYSWQARTADRATILWEADVVGGVLSLTYINPDYSIHPIIEASWVPALGAPLDPTWLALFQADVSGSFVTVGSNDQVITGRKRGAAKWKFGDEDDNYSSSYPGGQRVSITHRASQGDQDVQHGVLNTFIWDVGMPGSNEQGRASVKLGVVETDEYIQKIALDSAYLEIRGAPIGYGDSLFVATHQGQQYGGSEIPVIHGSFNTIRLEPGALGSITLARPTTSSVLNFGEWGGGAVGYIDTGEALYAENYIGPDAKTGAANTIVSRIDNDGEVTNSFGIRVQYYNDGTITGDHFGLYFEQLNGNLPSGAAWSIYSQTSANNYLAGDLRIGVTDFTDEKFKLEQGSRATAQRNVRTDNGAIGVIMDHVHVSASPAPGDTPHRSRAIGLNSSGSERIYAAHHSEIVATTAGAESGQHVFRRLVAGTDGTGAFIAAGVGVGSVSDPGAGILAAETGLITGSSGLTQVSGGRQRFTRGTIGDDSVVTVTLNASLGGEISLMFANLASGVKVRFDTSGTSELALISETEAFVAIDLTTGALTGTTGADNRITISISGTTFYFENRAGLTVTYGLLTLD